jgi:hypothetical protein
MVTLFNSLGKSVIDVVNNLGSATIFFSKSFVMIFRPKQLPEIIQQVYHIGARSSNIVMLVGLFTGMVLGLQLDYVLAKFGSGKPAQTRGVHQGTSSAFDLEELIGKYAFGGVKEDSKEKKKTSYTDEKVIFKEEIRLSERAVEVRRRSSQKPRRFRLPTGCSRRKRVGKYMIC